MTTMRDLFEAAEFVDETSVIEDLLALDEDDLVAVFSEADASQLDDLADLFESHAEGLLDEDEGEALEAGWGWIMEKAAVARKRGAPVKAPAAKKRTRAVPGVKPAVRRKGAVKGKLKPGEKMVFGKVVKVGRAIKKGAGMLSRAAHAVGRAAVAAKRGVQAHTFAFSKAGKQTRALAKKVRETHGRAAAKAVHGASKAAYQAASRSGESRGYAKKQAGQAAAAALKKSKAAKYH